MMCLQISIAAMEMTAEMTRSSASSSLTNLTRSSGLTPESVGPASNVIITVSNINWAMKIQKNAGHHEGWMLSRESREVMVSGDLWWGESLS